jgi:hypothetical protein
MFNENVVAKKRGRKPKNPVIEESPNLTIDKKEEIIQFLSNEDVVEEELKSPVIKKRGRKPKGGKIIQNINTSSDNNNNSKPSVILHLKCCLKDLETNVMNSNIESFYFSSNKHDLSYEIIEAPNINNDFPTSSVINNNLEKINIDEDDDSYYNKEIETKEIWKKLKQLEHNLHNNNINNKKSACFWCTYDFDNPPIYIPKHFLKNSYHVYGCFCSPECAVAHLMEENIDSSSKFERYYLINHIYSKIYDYKQNIKPSPNPYYMLDKYYGNLSIQEYRSLLRNERLFLIIEKPLTRIMPELHEDNDDFIINNKIIPSNNYQIRKKLQKKVQSKNNIMNEKFGIV